MAGHNVSLAKGMSSEASFGDGTLDDWIFLTDNMGLKFASEDGATELTNIIGNVTTLRDSIVNYQSAFAKNTESINNALNCLEIAKNRLDQIGQYNIEHDMDLYNDNKEIALGEDYRRYLRSVCQTWNNYAYGKTRYIHTWRKPGGGRITSAGWSGGYYHALNLSGSLYCIEDEDGNTIYGEPIDYDEINYDLGIKKWVTFLDMSNDNMVKELQKRSGELGAIGFYQLQDLKRPENTSIQDGAHISQSGAVHGGRGGKI